MKNIYRFLCSLLLLLLSTMPVISQTAHLDSLLHLYDNIQQQALQQNILYDSIYRIIAQCKTDEQRLIQHKEIEKLDKKAQKLGQRTNKLLNEIEIEKQRIEQAKREAELSQKQEKLLAQYPHLILKGETNGHQWVDMGLPSGTKWATCNIGAKESHHVGTRIAWAETDTKKLFAPNTYLHNETPIPPYNNNPQYDIATAKWGEEWSTPTLQQWEELIQYCEWQYVMINAINGVLFTSKKTYNTIFLPSTGYTDDETYKLIYTKYNLAYWTATGIHSNGAYSYIANYEQGYITTTNRYVAHCVRAVCSKP